MLRAAILNGLPHGFSTRETPDLNAVLPDARLVLAKQVHSPDVATVQEPWLGDPAHVDALVTDRPGLLIGVVTADCAPVLLADGEAGVVGAAHAGWRGALGGVIENTVGAMVSLGARRERIVAAIGPTIAQSSYEIDRAMIDQFAGTIDPFLTPSTNPGRWQFDLPGFVAERLRQAEVTAVEDLAQDTYSQADRFYSFRRATHRGKATGGRQTSVIGL